MRVILRVVQFLSRDGGTADLAPHTSANRNPPASSLVDVSIQDFAAHHEA